MSVSDVGTSIDLRRLVPSRAAADLPAAFVRWMLRLLTVIIFVAATVIGVQLAAAAPTESPVTTSGSHG